jgi:hypothetical protein
MEEQVSEPALAGSTERDFDFLFGKWKVHNRRLRDRLVGSEEWEEFDATQEARPLLGGLGNEDEFRTDYDGDFIGMSFRFFDREKHQWVIYWADNRSTGMLAPPVVGSFSGDTGLFRGEDTHKGQPVLVRYLWKQVTTATPSWEQAFSVDDGQTWETNWEMSFTRVTDAP